MDDPLQAADSLKNIVPTSSSTDTRLSMPMTMIHRSPLSQSASNGTTIYAPYILEYSILAEYQILKKQDLPGVYVIPSDENCLLWYGVLFVRQGIYQGGVFRFSVHIPSTFPDGGCPKVIFDTKVFHPAIDESGELNLSEEFHEWKRNVNRIWHVIQYARRIFHKIETTTPLNNEAGNLYTKDTSLFKEKVRQCVEESKQQILSHSSNGDSHYIHFNSYNELIHNSVQEEMIQLSTADKIKNL